VIEVEGLRKLYDGKVALQDVGFTVPAGQICGYLGPNGAGKSTTVKILCGMLQPSAGRARVAGFDISQEPLEVKRRLGYVPESGALYGSLTPREYLTLICELFALEPKRIGERIDQYLRLFNLFDKADQRIETLSKGTRQKVLIASALVHEPEVILMDEPLDGLDVHSAHLVKDLLTRLAAEGKTVLYSSHILDVVERLCDRVIILHRGRTVADAPTHELLARSKDQSLEDVFQALTTTPEEQRLANELITSLRSGH
jgi:ABC-2 type transport system ATP-binding protein